VTARDDSRSRSLRSLCFSGVRVLRRAARNTFFGSFRKRPSLTCRGSNNKEQRINNNEKRSAEGRFCIIIYSFLFFYYKKKNYRSDKNRKQQNNFPFTLFIKYLPEFSSFTISQIYLFQ